MVITYLGHAGFLVESQDFLLVADPWLSPDGAFDGAWFQYPCNHDLAPLVRRKLAKFPGERFIYISHEHRDHFDEGFLRSLDDRDFTIVAPRFANDRLLRLLANYRCRRVAALANEESLELPRGSVTIYVDDSELNRDSAIVVRDASGAFFNMNDCKLFDILPYVLRREGRIDAFACQYSGATWHPTCYDYDEPRYAALSKKKVMGKFERVARAIETLEPKMFLPSAGPPCFLDEELRHINFEPMNIFPHQERLAAYLAKRLHKHPVPAPHLLPGDRVRVTPEGVTHEPAAREVHESLRAELEGYALRVGPVFPNRDCDDVAGVYERLKTALDAKLQRFTLASRIEIPLYFILREDPARGLRVDFANRSIATAGDAAGQPRYTITAPAWQMQRVLDGALTWEELSLTFRVRLSRAPDLYQPLLHAFLLLEPENVERYCERILTLENDPERMTVEVGRDEYSLLRRCPHQGADLSEATADAHGILTCPRHGWQFDLKDGGRCLSNGTSLCAVKSADLSPTPR